MNNYPYYNPYFQQTYPQNYSMTTPSIQKTSVKTVSGKEGVYAFPMAPDSSDMFLDENNPILWIAKTDSAGMKTVTPYTISQYEEKNEVSVFEERLKKVEDMLNAKSDSANTRSKKSESKHDERSE